MPTELTLTPTDYEVLKRIPWEWWDENACGADIAVAIDRKSGDVLRRMARFVHVGLAERRGGTTIADKTEIRRLAK